MTRSILDRTGIGLSCCVECRDLEIEAVSRQIMTPRRVKQKGVRKDVKSSRKSK